MAQVPYDPTPQAEPQNRVPDDYNRPNVSPAMFGGAIAEGVGKLGEGITEAAKFYGEASVDDQINKVLTQSDSIRRGQPGKMVMGADGTQQPDTGFLGTAGEQAMKAWQPTMQQLDDTIAAARKNLTNPRDQLMFDQQTRRYRSVWMNEVSAHADQQSKNWYTEVNTAGAQHAVDWISSHADSPDDMVHGAADLINFNVKNAQLKFGSNLSPQVHDQIVADSKRQALAAQTQAIGVKDPARALSILDANKDIAGVQYDNLANPLRARANQQTGIAAGDEEMARARAAPPSDTGSQIPVSQGSAYRPEGKMTGDQLQVLAGNLKGVKPTADEKAQLDAWHEWQKKQGGTVATPPPEGEGRGHPAGGASFRAPAAGAAGYGLINAPYLYPLDRKGEKGIVSPAEHYSFLKAQGASNNEALMLTGAAANESSFNATAVHDGGNGYGLYGHNTQHRIDMRGMSWQQQASAALNELRRRPEGALVNSAQSPDQLAIAEMHFEAPRGFTSSNPRTGDNYTGRLNTLRYFQQMNNGVMTGAAGAPHRSNIPPEGVGAGPDHPMYGVDTSPQVPGAPPPGLKASAYQAILDRTDLNPEEQQYALTHINQTLAAQQIAADSDAKAVKAANDQAANGFVTRMLTGQTQDIVAQIANDPSLNWETKRALGDAALQNSGDDTEKMKREGGPGYWNAYQAIFAGPDDPTRIAEAVEIWKRAGPAGDLTLKGAKELVDIMNKSHKDPDQNAINTTKVSLLKYGQSILTVDRAPRWEGEVVKPDLEGQRIFNAKFIPKFEAAYSDWVRKGKDPMDFLTQEQVDKLAQGLRPKAQMDAARLAADNAAAGIEAIPPAPANTNPALWSTIVSHPPATKDGTAIPMAAWSTALQMLLTSPTQATIDQFNASQFGRAGMDGAEILRQLQPPPAQAAAPAAAAPAPPTPAPFHAPSAPHFPRAGAAAVPAPAAVPAAAAVAPPKPGHGGLEHPTRNPEPQKPVNPQPVAQRTEGKSIAEVLKEAIPVLPKKANRERPPHYGEDVDASKKTRK